MKLNIRHLHLIKAICNTKNFARAAQQMNISQPALSRAVATLEEQLGCKLFDRSRKGVTPTVFGELLLKRGAPILQDVAKVERDLRLLQEVESGELVIGSGPLPAEISVGKAVAHFSRNYPKVNVRIIVDRTPNLLTRLHSRELDIFVADTRGINVSSELELIQLPIQQGYFCCRVGHPLLEKKGLVLKDIFAHPLAVMWFPKVLLESLAQKAGLQLNDVTDLPCAILECDYLKVLFDIIVGCDAVGLITGSILDNRFLQQQLTLLPISLPELNSHYGLVSLSRYAQSPVVKLFQQYMIEADEQCSRETQ